MHLICIENSYLYFLKWLLLFFAWKYNCLKIIIIIILFWKMFTLALADVFSLDFECQQVSSTL